MHHAMQSLVNRFLSLFPANVISYQSLLLSKIAKSTMMMETMMMETMMMNVMG